MPGTLADLVVEKIEQVGDTAAAEYFGVVPNTVAAWKNRKNLPSLAAVQKVWDESLVCQNPEIWSGANDQLQLLLPIYNNFEPISMLMLIAAVRRYGIEKIGIIPRLRTLIDEARNDLVEIALKTNSEWFIFMDHDIMMPCGSSMILRKYGLTLPEPKAGRNAITRLMSHPKDKRIVGGLYRDRQSGTRAQCEVAFRSPADNDRLVNLFSGKNTSDSLEETGWIAFGLVRIHRSVFEEMKAASAPGGLMEEIAPPKGRENEAPGYFQKTRAQRGEDVAFCRRAQKLGIKVYVDHGLLLGHIGNKIY